METLLRIGLSNAIVALLMALMVVTVACVWRRPAVLHALWLLVLVKLVTPPLIWVRIPWPIIPDSPPVAVVPTVEPVAVEPAPEGNATFVSDSEPTIETSAVETSVEPLESESVPPGERGRVSAPSSMQSLEATRGAYATPLASVYATCGVWLAGALAWYALALVRLRRFRQMLRHAVPAPESLRQRTQRLAEKLRLRRCPGVWLVPGRVAPMLWAAGGRPRILFPADLLKLVGVEQQNALLVHELAHLRRRDHWVRWLEFIAAGLYWWNPVLWFARRELREAEEQCCDAWVTSTLPGAGKTYATALLETLDFLSDAPPAMQLLASGVGRVVDLKRRLTMIMRGTTPRTLGWRGGVAVVGLGALLLPLLPAWVQAQPTPKTEDVKKIEDVKVVTPNALAEEAEKDGAELTRLRAELTQKQAEVAAITARIEAVTVRAKKRQANAARLEAIRALAKAHAGDVVNVTGDDDPQGRIVLDITGLDPSPPALNGLLEQIQATRRAGSSHATIVLRAANGEILMKYMEATGTIIADPNAAAPAHPPDTDKRILELEMTLKSILNEVEQLHRERTPDLHSYGPAPLEKVPYINQIFKKEGAETAETVEKRQADARLMMKKLSAERKEAGARRDSLHSQQQEAAQFAGVQMSLRANADAWVSRAEAELKSSEDDAELAEAQDQKDNNPVTTLQLKRTRKRVDEKRTTLEHAKVNQVKALADTKSNADKVKAALKRAEECAAGEEAAEKEMGRINEEYYKQYKASKAGDPPAKP
jgi:beta-lactamase regulating signal transducer with metallopeptidase domain